MPTIARRRHNDARQLLAEAFSVRVEVARAFLVAIALVIACGWWPTLAKVGEAETSGKTSWANGRFSGYFTIGCNDSYVYAPDGDTWFVNLTAQQRRELSTSLDSNYRWSTQFVVLDAVLHDVSRVGFFGRHRRQLDVTRVVSTRWLQPGESTNVSIGSKKYRGIAIPHQHGFGFVPLSRSDEMWEVVPGKIGWTELNRPFPTWKTNPSGAPPIVDLVGRLGPPGNYDHMDGAIREIAADEIIYLRSAEPSEIDNTAVFDGVIASINKCIPPPHRER